MLFNKFYMVIEDPEGLLVLSMVITYQVFKWFEKRIKYWFNSTQVYMVHRASNYTHLYYSFHLLRLYIAFSISLSTLFYQFFSCCVCQSESESSDPPEMQL